MTKPEYLALLLRSAGDGTFPAVVVAQAEHGPGRLRCMYRTPEGRRCAVGVLIPPEKYRPEVEGMDVLLALSFCGVGLPEGLTIADVWLIRQRHDVLARRAEGWDAAEFRASLLRLDCFRGFAGQEGS